MKATIVTRGFRQASDRFSRMARELRRELPSLVAQAARSCAQNYAYHSQPYGFSETSKVGFQLTIVGEVARVFTTRDNPSGIYLLIKKIDPLKAEQYWAAHKKGSKRRALDILNSVPIPRSPDISLLKSARTGKNAHVPKKIQPRALLTAPEQRAMIRRQQELVGFAKAGWYQAARALGRVRRSITRDDGTRTSEQIFPAYIRAVARRHPGIGSAKLIARGDSASCTISTDVRHAVNALPGGRQKQAEESADQAFRDACRIALWHISRNRRSAA